jgi:hypothetical protein
MGTILDSIVRKRVDEGLLQLKKELLYVEAEHQLNNVYKIIQQQLPEKTASDVMTKLDECFIYVNQLEYYHLYEKGFVDGLRVKSELG